jgi:hypothetical protein
MIYKEKMVIVLFVVRILRIVVLIVPPYVRKLTKICIEKDVGLVVRF